MVGGGAAAPPCAPCAPACAAGSYLRGLPLERWRLFMNSASSTIQNDPKSSSYLTKHLCNERLVRMAFCVRVEEGVGDGKERKRREDEKIIPVRRMMSECETLYMRVIHRACGILRSHEIFPNVVQDS